MYLFLLFYSGVPLEAGAYSPYSAEIAVATSMQEHGNYEPHTEDYYKRFLEKNSVVLIFSFFIRSWQ